MNNVAILFIRLFCFVRSQAETGLVVYQSKENPVYAGKIFLWLPPDTNIKNQEFLGI